MPTAQQRCILEQWLFQNPNRKPLANSRTHRSARPYSHHAQVAKTATNLTGAVSQTFAECLHHRYEPRRIVISGEYLFAALSLDRCTNEQHIEEMWSLSINWSSTCTERKQHLETTGADSFPNTYPTTPEWVLDRYKDHYKRNFVS